MLKKWLMVGLVIISLLAKSDETNADTEKLVMTEQNTLDRNGEPDAALIASDINERSMLHAQQNHRQLYKLQEQMNRENTERAKQGWFIAVGVAAFIIIVCSIWIVKSGFIKVKK